MKFIILGHWWVFSKTEGLGHEIYCLHEGDFFGRMKFCQRINVHVCNTIQNFVKKEIQLMYNIFHINTIFVKELWHSLLYNI